MGDDQCQAVVMIPTVGDPELLIGCVQRLLEATTLQSWQLLIVINPVAATVPLVGIVKGQIGALVDSANAFGDSAVDLRWVELPAAAGWTGAVNAGVRALCVDGMPEVVAIINDDVLVTTGWLARMGNALDPEFIIQQGEVGPAGDAAPPRAAESYGKIGMVGPCSNEVCGLQKVTAPDMKFTNGAAFTNDGPRMLERFAADFTRKGNPYPMSASFLSGLCVVYRRACIADMLFIDESGDACLLNPAFAIGGYDDNDIAVRAQHAGWRLVIAGQTYVHHLGHQTLDAHFPEAQRGLGNAAEYLRQWESTTDRDHRVVAIYRMKWDVPWDVSMLSMSLRRVAQLVDGIAILATNNPADVVSNAEWESDRGRMSATDAKLVAACADSADSESIVSALNAYLAEIAPGVDTVASLHRAETWNERDERNAAIQLGMTLQPDWMLSVDHDEIPEDRITRGHLRRLTRHPDPAVTHYDTGWINHWDSPRLARVDAPWAHGWTSSMRGFRLWRVMHSEHQQIIAGNEIGLHCGNVPDTGQNAKRVAAWRWRHYGYMRPQDRRRKYQRYMQIDRNPDAMLTQGTSQSRGGYAHLVDEEGMSMQAYRPDNGIGLTMLWHAGEQSHDLMRWLDLSYGVADQIVLVWTGPEDSAPSDDMQYIAARFGARWISHPLDDDLAAARNAGVDELRRLGCGWCWVMDPDEHMAPAFATLVSIRRLAECANGWAWMFRFRNYRPGGTFNWSENTRMFRLDGGILRFNGRVHETLEHGLARLGASGVHPNVRYAPFIIEHLGLSRGDAATQQKLVRYTRLLSLQIRDAPLTSPGAWVSLGLQFGNDGLFDEQWRCYEIALRTAGNGYLPFREAALHHLRKGRQLLAAAAERLSPAHELRDATIQLVETLSQHAPDQPVLGAARRGATVPPDVNLDELIDLAESAAAAALADSAQSLPMAGPTVQQTIAVDAPASGVQNQG